MTANPPSQSPPGPHRHTADLHLTGVSDKAGLLAACARDLQLPDWFGRNWDALADCLTDLSWWGRPGSYLLRVRGWEEFRTAAPEAAATAAGIFAEAEAYWGGSDTPMTVRYDPETPDGAEDPDGPQGPYDPDGAPGDA
ncbi:barstar family protein [Streptomyces sp. B1866]|uniref:barstar family protein n=1 Tax=Streptomyces sp. B1866 TaxID=3075431 RepID=UPI00288CB768|nr:barstar family protein [Streptomyces sp. B1866]MDT3399223.1 barstar family protein [Streptomyces sp. B1866]